MFVCCSGMLAKDTICTEMAFMHVEQNTFFFFSHASSNGFFVLQWNLAKDTICVEMAFMLMERNRLGSTNFLFFPFSRKFRGILCAAVACWQKTPFVPKWLSC